MTFVRAAARHGSKSWIINDTDGRWDSPQVAGAGRVGSASGSFEGLGGTTCLVGVLCCLFQVVSTEMEEVGL